VSAWDAIVIGGSYAGLSAAMMLARGRRSVLVLDAGARRNRFAASSHGVLAQDGRAGSDIVADASAQLARYPSVRQEKGLVASVEGLDGRFVVRSDGGAAYRGRKILLATGVTDLLPPVPGLADRWGRCVFHCPYCHGYEIGGGAIAVLATGPASVGQASTVADWGEVTLFTQGLDLDPGQRALLERRGVAVDGRPVTALDGPLDGPILIRLGGNAEARVEALFIASRQSVSPLASALGCAVGDTPHGQLIETQADKLTSVAGIYAAGDTARLPTNVTLASADGVLAGAAIHQALIAADAERVAAG
jgi:thioredoxin reductase